MTGTLISANIGAPAVSREDALKSTRKIFLDNIMKGAPWLRLRLYSTTRSIKIMIMGQHSFINWVDSFLSKNKCFFLILIFNTFTHTFLIGWFVDPWGWAADSHSSWSQAIHPHLCSSQHHSWWWWWWIVIVGDVDGDDDNTAGDDCNWFRCVYHLS